MTRLPSSLRPTTHHAFMLKLIKKILSRSPASDTDGAGQKSAQTIAADSVEYKGFVVTPAPIVEAGQFRTAGKISRTDANDPDATPRESHYIRADNHTDKQQAIDHSLAKGKQVIDERGEQLLDSERC